MINIDPSIPLKLWIFYTEDYIPITDLTDLTITILDQDGNIILNSTQLTENISNNGYYSHTVDISSIAQETVLYVYFKKGTSIINIEEYFVDITSDNIARAF